MTTGVLGAIAEVAALLGSSGKPGAIIGGIAFVARIRPRYTNDVDIIVGLGPTEREAFLSHAAGRGFRFERADRQNFLEAGFIRMQSSLDYTVDAMVADDELLESTLRRATLLDVGGAQVPVATAEDLLLMKLDANRYLDLDDAIAIKDALGSQLDRAYLDQMARKLGLEERLRNLLGPG